MYHAVSAAVTLVAASVSALAGARLEPEWGGAELEPVSGVMELLGDVAEEAAEALRRLRPSEEVIDDADDDVGTGVGTGLLDEVVVEGIGEMVEDVDDALDRRLW